MSTVSSKKRKTLHDYFTSPTQKHDPSPPSIARISQPPTSPIPGLSIIPNFVSTTEETALLSFLDAQQWRTDLSRRTIHYGGTYCLMPPRNATPDERKRIESTIVTANPIPSELKWLVDRMVDRPGLYALGMRPEFCIVNEYISKLGISAHVENFRFAEPVCALTVGDGDSMRFHELSSAHDGSVRSGKAASAPRTGRKVDVWLPSRSLLVMAGEARWSWQHEIVRGRKRDGNSSNKAGRWRRVSLTFRVEKEKKEKKTTRGEKEITKSLAFQVLKEENSSL